MVFWTTCRSINSLLLHPIGRAAAFTCLTVVVKVPKQVAREECHNVPRETCHNVPKKKCERVPKQECRNIPRQECKQVPKETCQNVPKGTSLEAQELWELNIYSIFTEECHNVPKQTCTKVPKQQCSKVPKEECKQGKFAMTIWHHLTPSCTQCPASSAAMCPSSRARMCPSRTARQSTNVLSANSQPTAELISVMIISTQFTISTHSRACLAYAPAMSLYTCNVLIYCIYSSSKIPPKIKLLFPQLPVNSWPLFECEEWASKVNWPVLEESQVCTLQSSKWVLCLIGFRQGLKDSPAGLQTTEPFIETPGNTGQGFSQSPPASSNGAHNV